MADLKILKQLGIASATKTVPKNLPTDFEKVDINTIDAAFAGELKKIAGDYNLFRRNKLDVCELMQEITDEVLPKLVRQNFMMLGEVKTVEHGQKVTLKRNVGRARAKSFITKVGLGGVFETFRLDKETASVAVEAIGGGAILDFERLLSGEEDMAGIMEIILEGISEKIYTMFSGAINASANSAGIFNPSGARPTGTAYSANTFDKAEFDKIITTVKAYGDPIIVCTPEFADTIPGNYITVSGTTRISDKDVDDIRTYGVLQVYKGAPVVVLPQSFTDETNTTKVLDPKFAYIVPGLTTKLGTIVLEGGTIYDLFQNKDKSYELSAYQKVGVVITHTNDWGIYENTSLA